VTSFFLFSGLFNVAVTSTDFMICRSNIKHITVSNAVDITLGVVITY
jgi:hypothetical protein